MAKLPTQVFDVKLLGLDEKANPREAIPGTLTELDNCVLYKDGRVQKRPGIAPLTMLDRYGTVITNARELATHNGQLLLNDGVKWYLRHPVSGAWIPVGYSAYERLNISGMSATTAACNGTDSRLEIDSAVIGRYGLTVMSGGPVDTDWSESGWMLTDIATGSVIIRKQQINIQAAQAGTDGATSESFVVFGVNPITESEKSTAIVAYVISSTGLTVQIGNVVTDASWSNDLNTYELHAIGKKAVCFEALRVAANTWLLAYHQYQSDGGDHSHVVVRTVTRTTGATFTVSDPTTVIELADQQAASLSWAYTSGSTAHLAWEEPPDAIRSASVDIATRTVGAATDLDFADWNKCRGMVGCVIQDQKYFFVDLVDHWHRRQIRLWAPGVGDSMLVRDAGLLSKTFSVENQRTDEIGLGVCVLSGWQPSAFLMRVRVSGDDQVASTVGAHLAAGDFAGRPMSLKLPSMNGGAFMPFGKMYDQSSIGWLGTVSVVNACVANPLPVWTTPTPTAYPTQGQPVEVGGTTVFPGAALKEFDGESVFESTFYLAPDSVSGTDGSDSGTMEIGTRLYTATITWTDAKGRIHESSPCIPASVTTEFHRTISVTVPNVHLTEHSSLYSYLGSNSNATIKVYRTAVNDSVFYLVKTLVNTVNGAAQTFTDDIPDANITAFEQLYTIGGQVRNWPVIGCKSLTLHQGRAFALQADGKVSFTSSLQDGEALSFSDEYVLDTEHIPGTITTLLSLDDKLLICTESSCATLTGIGPEVTGLPVYDSPTVINSTVGPAGPRACVRVPDGVMFPTRHGFHMVDRGLTFRNVGPAVETSATVFVPGYASACTPNNNQARIFGSGTTKAVLVFDWTLPGVPNRVGQWMRWAYSVDVVAAVVCNGVLYYLGHNAVVYQADSGTSDGGVAYQQSLQFSVLSPAGVNAWARIKKMRLAVDIATGCTLKAYLNPEEGNLSAPETHIFLAETPGKRHVDLKPRHGRTSSVTCWIGESAASTNAGFVLDSVALEVGNKGGLGRMPSTSRMTRST
jgi:hypothetical protein